MTSPVSYTRMAQAAVVVVATSLYLKQSRKITTLTLGILGSAVVGIAGKMIHYTYENLFKWYQYKVGAFRRFDPEENNAALSKAIEQIKLEYPEQYQLYLEKSKLTDDTQLSEHFVKKLQEGCCAGTANAIFDRIHRHQNHSLRDSAFQIKDEEVFYFQLLNHFRCLLAQRDSLDVELGRRL